jgi:hypothetical protein
MQERIISILIDKNCIFLTLRKLGTVNNLTVLIIFLRPDYNNASYYENTLAY